MNHRIHVFAAVGALALVGCAPQASQPGPGIDSPASSKASESPIPLSDTLTLARLPDAVQGAAVEPQQLKPEMQPGLKGTDQGMPGMNHGTPHISPGTQPGENTGLSAPRWTPTTVPASQPAAATLYTCKMHPKVISNTPGTCPICGMKLIPKPPETQPANAGNQHDGHQQGGQP